MGTVAENKQQKEQRLLNAAFSLFTTQGSAKTSIADIVERAGMAKGTFYLYFRDKLDIQTKLIVRESERIFGHAVKQVQGHEYHDFADRLIAIVDDVLDQLRRDPITLRFINKNLSWGVFRRALDSSSEDYLAIMEEMLRASGEQSEDPQLLLYTIVELVGSTCHSIILEQDPVGFEQYKPYLHRVIRAIIEEFRVVPAEIPQEHSATIDVLPIDAVMEG